ncbi:hypothetical protein [Rhizobium sp. BK602]|uniref:hypothetical protein n=1 Tax=Rhizobium sp. BK602 TaxID=2586986 RepID=UPI00160C332A|nr:hypothetical protein [Rhizobium sp. BK602]MBB3611508.1 flagellar biosynthesis regulator FlbT [Rhizobium sp. BK602]
MGFSEEIQLVARIGDAEDVGEAFELYRRFFPLIGNYKFILAADKGARPGYAVNRNFSAGAVVRSLFKTDHVLVLDVDTLHDMEATGQSTYPIDYSISLDTQALSYLEPYMAGRSVPKDFKEVFEFIACDDVYVDPTPYLMENLRNLDDPAAADKIFGKLKAYEILRTLDTNLLSSKDIVRSKLSEQELLKRTQEHVSRMYMDRGRHDIMNALNFRHQFQYSCLLKMVSIQLSPSKTSINEKIAAFLEFSHSQLATMAAREIALARAYFERGQNLTFFGKIQRNRSDILGQLDNMAWDLLHIRQLEKMLTLASPTGRRYFFSALLTFDKRFIEVIDLYPLKSCAFKTDGKEIIPFYDGDWLGLISSKPDNSHTEMVEKYFSGNAIASRDARRDDAKRQLADVVRQLEDDVRRTLGTDK